MKTKTYRLVSPGRQKNGQTVTEQHLDQVVANYNPDARPPICLGHPKSDSVPAFGRVQNPRKAGADLVVELAYTPELEALEHGGYFEGFSAGIYPNGQGQFYLHHVAALGELPPAADIKRLSVVGLSGYSPDKLITLSATAETMMDEEKVKNIIEAALKPLGEKVNALEAQLKAKQSGKKLSDSGNDDSQKGEKTDNNNRQPLVDEEARKQLSTLYGTVKADRIKAVKAAAKQKGLEEKQIQPMLNMMEKAEPVELSHDGKGGLYTEAMAFIDGLDSPVKENPAQLLELSDNKGEALDLDALAAKF